MALLSGAAVLLALAVANPDAWIARHNIERYHATGKVDWGYLRGLSADATPTLAALPGAEATLRAPRAGARSIRGPVDRLEPRARPGEETTWPACTSSAPPPSCP